jgi:hypothetical protein
MEALRQSLAKRPATPRKPAAKAGKAAEAAPARAVARKAQGGKK